MIPRQLTPAIRFLPVLLLILAAGRDLSADPVIPPRPPDPVIVGRACTPDQLGAGALEFSEVSADLIGGLSGLQARLVYPDADRRAGTEGTVVLRFVVGLDGQACNTSIARPLSPGLDAASVAALEASTFTPGRQNGQPVALRMSLPVRFTLP